MRVRNNIDRCHLLMEIAKLAGVSEEEKQNAIFEMNKLLAKHKEYITQYMVVRPEQKRKKYLMNFMDMHIRNTQVVNQLL